MDMQQLFDELGERSQIREYQLKQLKQELKAQLQKVEELVNLNNIQKIDFQQRQKELVESHGQVIEALKIENIREKQELIKYNNDLQQEIKSTRLDQQMERVRMQKDLDQAAIYKSECEQLKQSIATQQKRIEYILAETKKKCEREIISLNENNSRAMQNYIKEQQAQREQMHQSQKQELDQLQQKMNQQRDKLNNITSEYSNYKINSEKQKFEFLEEINQLKSQIVSLQEQCQQRDFNIQQIQIEFSDIIEMKRKMNLEKQGLEVELEQQKLQWAESQRMLARQEEIYQEREEKFKIEKEDLKQEMLKAQQLIQQKLNFVEGQEKQKTQKIIENYERRLSEIENKGTKQLDQIQGQIDTLEREKNKEIQILKARIQEKIDDFKETQLQESRRELKEKSNDFVNKRKELEQKNIKLEHEVEEQKKNFKAQIEKIQSESTQTLNTCIEKYELRIQEQKQELDLKHFQLYASMKQELEQTIKDLNDEIKTLKQEHQLKIEELRQSLADEKNLIQSEFDTKYQLLEDRIEEQIIERLQSQGIDYFIKKEQEKYEKILRDRDLEKQNMLSEQSKIQQKWEQNTNRLINDFAIEKQLLEVEMALMLQKVQSFDTIQKEIIEDCEKKLEVQRLAMEANIQRREDRISQLQLDNSTLVDNLMELKMEKIKQEQKVHELEQKTQDDSLKLQDFKKNYELQEGLFKQKYENCLNMAIGEQIKQLEQIKSENIQLVKLHQTQLERKDEDYRELEQIYLERPSRNDDLEIIRQLQMTIYDMQNLVQQNESKFELMAQVKNAKKVYDIFKSTKNAENSSNLPTNTENNPSMEIDSESKMMYQIELKNKLKFNQFKYQQIVKNQIQQDMQTNFGVSNSQRSQKILLSSARRSRSKKNQSMEGRTNQSLINTFRNQTTDMRYSSSQQNKNPIENYRDPIPFSTNFQEKLSPIKDLEPHLIHLNSTNISYRNFLFNKRNMTQDYSKNPTQYLNYTGELDEPRINRQIKNVLNQSKNNRREEFRPQTQGEKRQALELIHD